MNETQTLAEFATALTLSEIPADTRAQGKRLILDQLGCQIGSSGLPWSQHVYQTTRAFGSSGRSVIMAMGDRMRPDDAAFINGTFGAANEIDDANMVVRMHAGAVVVPAAFAVAQDQQVSSGADLLLAILVGYEVAYRVASAGFPLLMERNHHTSASCGPFGSGAATARLLGLDAAGMVNTLAIAASHSAGIMEYTESGGSVKRTYTGIGAQAGVRSGYLTLHGLTGPSTALEGKRGFLESFADRRNVSRLVEGLGGSYLINGTGLKNYHAEYRIHPPLQALEILVRDNKLVFDDIETMRVGVSSVTVEAVGTIIEPSDTLGAQFSMRFALALAARYGAAGLREIPDSRLRDPELLALAHRIEMYVEPSLEAEKWTGFGAVLSIVTKSGQTFTTEQSAILGSLANPMTDAQVASKFRSLAEPVIGADRCDAIVAAVGDLENATVDDVLSHVAKV
jgi:2-methylcitrate dehydratase PrpD